MVETLLPAENNFVFHDVSMTNKTEPSHDQLLTKFLCEVLPPDLAALTQSHAGSSRVSFGLDPDTEAVNQLLLTDIERLERDFKNVQEESRPLRFHPGQYCCNNNGEGHWLDRDEWDWWTCCQVENKFTNRANRDLVGCKWRVSRPDLQSRLAELERQLSDTRAQLRCSVCGERHAGDQCSYKRCTFCLKLSYFRCRDCDADLDKYLEPARAAEARRMAPILAKQRADQEQARLKQEAKKKALKQEAAREARKLKRKHEPCGKFLAGLCRRGDHCSRSHS
jgi:hypothetical protein